ncbi:lysozyme [uncultured Gilvimarinus sp.]|mgnify:CR=1 FL=1|uniref:lysozyme n=1 Tax=uncultured Gilvimarinus sp. TaxID=1689143 RepID=UPI0030DD02D3
MNNAAKGFAGLSAAAVLAITLIIKPFEGREDSYVDPVGVWTSCYGHTGEGVVPGREYSDAECEALLRLDTLEREAQLLRYVRVPISDEIRASLISFVYNVGVGNFRSSTLLKKLNAGDYVGACNELTRWTYAGGERLAGLVRRREAERQLCLRGARP